MRIARSVTRLYWMTIFELKGPLHSHCRVPSDFFVQTPQKIVQNRLVFCAFHQRNKETDEEGTDLPDISLPSEHVGDQATGVPIRVRLLQPDSGLHRQSRPPETWKKLLFRRAA